MRAKRYARKKAPEVENPSKTSKGGTRKPRIRCPACSWEPDGKKRWQCELCFALFDTFKTMAHCPECPNSWAWTQCIRCGERSAHEAWYESEA